MKRTEIARGLYPRAPELRRGSRSTPAEDFWVVKHGVKALSKREEIMEDMGMDGHDHGTNNAPKDHQ